MKKVYLIASIAMLGLATSCSNDSAFTEEEKQKQDSADNSSQEDKFKNLEQEMADDSANKANFRGPNQQAPMMKEPAPQKKPDKDAVQVSAEGDINPPTPNEKK
jgi:hypothetical protein